MELSMGQPEMCVCPANLGYSSSSVAMAAGAGHSQGVVYVDPSGAQFTLKNSLVNPSPGIGPRRDSPRSRPTSRTTAPTTHGDGPGLRFMEITRCRARP